MGHDYALMPRSIFWAFNFVEITARLGNEGVLLTYPFGIPSEPGFLKSEIVRFSEYPSTPVTHKKQKKDPGGSSFCLY